MSASQLMSGVNSAAAELVEELINRLQTGGDVESFVAAHPEHADDLRRLLPAAQVLADLSRSSQADGSFPPSADGPVTGILGDFRIIREVGRGGMGIVYEAEQISLGRRVALKVLPFASTMDPRQLQRFHNEARAAASLHHEHVVPVYGVGCERGVHYYAMQFVDGTTLAELIHGRAESRDPGERGRVSAPSDLLAPEPSSPLGALTRPRSPETAPVAALSTERSAPKGRAFYRHAAELMAQAADALEHAHGMGVVHRDVKPGNLMVDAAGKLWVTDFGLARLATDAGLTMSGDLLGTLRYMSPEQALASHGLVDHRSDVYGLGATLYELLTGRPAVGGTDRVEILRGIAFEEPVRPRKIDKAIPAELETVTLKALAKDPAERYATAGELADDLRRFAEDRPIRAKPPTLRQRTAKWARRHRAGIGVAVASLILATIGLTAGVVVLARKESEAQRANAKAQRRLEQLEKGHQLLGSIFEKLDPAAEKSGGPSLREQLKAQLRHAMQALDAEAIGDELMVVKLQFTLGASLVGLGEPADASTLFQKALVTCQRLLGPDDATTLGGMNNLALCYGELGRYADAAKLHEETLALIKAKLGPDHPRTLLSMNNLAANYANLGRRADALKLNEEALARRKATLGPDHPDTLQSMYNLAGDYGALGRFADAVKLREEALALFKVKLGPDHPKTLTCMYNLAFSYRREDRLADALKLNEEALARRTATLGADHPDTLQSMNGLAVSYSALGRHAEAAKLHEDALARRKAVLGPDHPSTLQSVLNLAASHIELGRPADAASLFSEAFAAEPKLAGDMQEQHRYNAACAAALAGCGQGNDAGKLDEAGKIRLRRQALDWLTADLAAWGKIAEKAEARPKLRGVLSHWQGDTDFNGVRGDAMANLPEAERAAWQKLWADVAALKDRCQPPAPNP